MSTLFDSQCSEAGPITGGLRPIVYGYIGFSEAVFVTRFT